METKTPVAWMRKWHLYGEQEFKVLNEKTGRMKIHRKFTILPVTILKRFDDDIPLFVGEDSKNSGFLKD